MTLGSTQVTCIVITYRQAPWVHQTLESIFAQTRPFDEIIIIDDASPDDTAEAIHSALERLGKTDHAHVIINEKNRGLCANLNHALSLVKTPYYAYIAGDDYMREDRVETQLAYLESLPKDYVMVYSDAARLDETTGSFLEPFSSYYDWPDTDEGDLFSTFIETNWVPAPSVMLRTEVVKAEGGYDESLFYEDHDLWVRLSAKYKIACIKDCLVTQRERHSSLGATKFHEHDLDFSYAQTRILSKHIGDPRLEKDLSFQVWRAGRRLLAHGYNRSRVIALMRAGRRGIDPVRYYAFLAIAMLRIPNWIVARKPAK